MNWEESRGRHRSPRFLYVGTYTEPRPFPSSRGEGIHVFRLDQQTGEPLSDQVVGDIPNPSFLAFHPSGRCLYAVSEIEDGSVSAFAVDPASGRLTFMNRRLTGGSEPAHVSVDPSGRHLLVANYGSGHWSLFPLQPNGSLNERTDLLREHGSGPHLARQEGPHAHMTAWDPSGHNLILGCDLGLDRIMVWTLDANADKLIAGSPPWWQADSGSGPRFLAYHPRLPCVYVVKELDSTITVFGYDAARGSLAALQAATTLPDGFTGESTAAHISVHPSGVFLYASNRGHDSIAAYAIDQGTGRIRPAGWQPSGGRTPRNFDIDGAGALMYVANQDSDSVVVLRINEATGALAPTGGPLPVPSPVCIVLGT